MGKKFLKLIILVFLMLVAQPNIKVGASGISQSDFETPYEYMNNINILEAWKKTRGSNEVVVAILGEGVDVNAPQLKGKIYKPFNVLNGTSTFKTIGSTYYASIIAGNGNVGIAPSVKIMPIEITSNNLFYYETSDFVRAIFYAVENGAKIINVSAKGTSHFSLAESEAIRYATLNGVSVFAQFNDSGPGRYNYVFRICPIDNKGIPTYFFGTSKNMVDFYAAGSPNDFVPVATATGVAALVASLDPLITRADMYNTLKASAIKYWKPDQTYYYGNGRVNAGRATKYTKQLLDIKYNPKFIFSNGNKFSIQFLNKYNGKLSSDIYNSAGTHIKNLTKEKPIKPGNNIFYWDGTKTNGTYISSGKYKIKTSININGRTFLYFSNVDITNVNKPFVYSDQSVIKYSPKRSKLSVSYRLNLPIKLTAQVVDSKGKVVKNIMSNLPVSKNNVVITWDGKSSSSKIVPNGKYNLLVYGKDKSNRITNKKYITVFVDSGSPVISKNIISTKKFNVNDTAKLSGSFYISKNARVTVNIINNKKVVKTLINQQLRKGQIKYQWNGLYSSGYDIKDGNHTVDISVVDEYGNLSKVQTIINVVDQRIPKVFIKDADTTKFMTLSKPTKIEFTLTKDSYLTIKINQAHRGGQFIKTISQDKFYKKGTHTVIWDAKDDNGDLVKIYNHNIYFYVKSSLSGKVVNTTSARIFVDQDAEQLVIKGPDAIVVPSSDSSDIIIGSFDVETSEEIKDIKIDVYATYLANPQYVKINTIYQWGYMIVKDTDGRYYFTWDKRDKYGQINTDLYKDVKFVVNIRTEDFVSYSKEIMLSTETNNDFNFKYQSQYTNNLYDTLNHKIDVTMNNNVNLEFKLFNIYDQGIYNISPIGNTDQMTVINVEKPTRINHQSYRHYLVVSEINSKGQSMLYTYYQHPKY
ncbi:MAG: family serine peptidase [Bacillales bacterium]|jgi:flagellar hook assembly protein FlgD|nr:family serine peptidase [Bacillales bacterium]